MAARKLTKDGLAMCLHIARSNLIRRLSGQKAWTISELDQVAAYLNMPLWDLFEAAENRQQKKTR